MGDRNLEERTANLESGLYRLRVEIKMTFERLM